MASLFNTKISNTYVGLLKMSDNLILSSSLREISDGSGNGAGVYLNTSGDLKATGILEFGSLKDTGLNITISKFVNEADGIANNDNDTSIPTSAAIVDYVASRITLEDLDFSGDSGTGSVDLDSQTFAIVGTANEIETSAGSQQLQIGLPSNVNITNDLDVGGEVAVGTDNSIFINNAIRFKNSGDAFIDHDVNSQRVVIRTKDGSGSYVLPLIADSSGVSITGGITATGTITGVANLSDGSTAETQSLNDNSTKIATTAYVDASIDTTDTLAEILAIGNTTGGTNIAVSANDDITFTDSSEAIFGDGTDLKIFHNGTDSLIVNETGHLYLRNKANDKDIVFDSDDGAGGTTEYFRVDGSGVRTVFSKNIRLGDDVQLNIGASDDLRLVHSPDNSFIQNFTGDLQISNFADDKDILFRCDDNSGGLETYFFLDGSENRVTSNKEFRFIDNAKAKFGTSGDLEIYHDGSNSVIADTGTGELRLAASAFRVLNANLSETLIFAEENGKVQLRYDESTKFETTSAGVTVTGVVTADGLDVGDNEKIRIGSSQDLEIYHDGSNSYIEEKGTGDLIIKSYANMFLKANFGGVNDETFISNTGNGGVGLFFNGVEKAETVSGGFSVSGTLVTTGDITSNGDIIIDNSSGDPFLKLKTAAQEYVIRIDQSDSEKFQIRNVTGSTTPISIDTSDNITLNGSLIIGQDLTVNGTTTTVNTQTLAVEDPLISLAKDNAANSVDIGFYGRYNDGSDKYLGLFADASDSNNFKLFKGTGTEPTTTVDTSATGYVAASLTLDSLNSNNIYNGEYIYHSNNTSTNIRFLTDRMLLTSGGGAVVDLHSNGQLYFTGASTFYNNITLSGASSPKIRTTDTTNTVTNKLMSDDSAGYVGTETNHDLSFLINNSQVAKLDTSGNFGVLSSGSVNRDLLVKKSTDGGNVRIASENTSNTADSDAVVSMAVAGSDGGDAFAAFTVSSVLNWSIGVDNSDSDKLKISKNFGPGSNDYLVIDTTGNSTFTENLAIGGTAHNDRLTIFDSDDNVGLYFQTTTSGTTSGDGFRLGLNNTHGFIWNYENTPISFGTNGSQKATILANGNTGIGVSDPAGVFQVRQTNDTVSNILSNGDYGIILEGHDSGSVGDATALMLSGKTVASSPLRGVALIGEIQDSGNGHDFIIATNTAGNTPTESFRIKGDGAQTWNMSNADCTISGNTSGNITMNNTTGTWAFRAEGSSVNSMTISSTLITLNEDTTVNGNLTVNGGNDNVIGRINSTDATATLAFADSSTTGDNVQIGALGDDLVAYAGGYNAAKLKTFDGSTASSNTFISSELSTISYGKTGWGFGDIIGRLSFHNTDASGIGARDAASIVATNEAGNGSTTTTFSGALVFNTSNENASANEKMRLSSNGSLVLRNFATALDAPASGYLKEMFIANVDGVGTFASNGASNGAYGSFNFQTRKGDSSDPLNCITMDNSAITLHRNVNADARVKVSGSATDQYYFEGERSGTGVTYRLYDNSNNVYHDSYTSQVFRVNQIGGSGGKFIVQGGESEFIRTTANSTILDLQNTLINVGGASVDSYSAIRFTNTTSGGSHCEIRQYANAWANSLSDLAFFTGDTSGSSTERMRLKANGRLDVDNSIVQENMGIVGHSPNSGTINNGSSFSYNANTAGGNQAAGFIVISAVPNGATEGGAVEIWTHIHTQGANVYSKLSGREENNITISESSGSFTISNSSGSTVYYNIRVLNITDFASTIGGY